MQTEPKVFKKRRLGSHPGSQERPALDVGTYKGRNSISRLTGRSPPGPFPFVFSPPASVKVGVMLLTGKAYVLLTGKTPRVQKKVANFT